MFMVWLPRHVFTCRQDGFSLNICLVGYKSSLTSASAKYQKLHFPRHS